MDTDSVGWGAPEFTTDGGKWGKNSGEDFNRRWTLMNADGELILFFRRAATFAAKFDQASGVFGRAGLVW